jgi:hypothetical protein
VVIDAEFGREDYGSIPRNCDWRGLKSLDARIDPWIERHMFTFLMQRVIMFNLTIHSHFTNNNHLNQLKSPLNKFTITKLKLCSLGALNWLWHQSFESRRCFNWFTMRKYWFMHTLKGFCYICNLEFELWSY